MVRLAVLLDISCETDLQTVYYMQSDPEQLEFARKLHERIRREFPEVSYARCSQRYHLY